MAHEIAKLLLEHAGTFLERAEAVRAAMSLGMPLSDIEEYLDWLESTRGSRANSPAAADVAASTPEQKIARNERADEANVEAVQPATAPLKAGPADTGLRRDELPENRPAEALPAENLSTAPKP